MALKHGQWTKLIRQPYSATSNFTYRFRNSDSFLLDFRTKQVWWQGCSSKIIFVDESCLTRRGIINFHNKQVYSHKKQMFYDLKNRMYFMHDGVPPHLARNVRQFLNDHFPHWWIDRGQGSDSVNLTRACWTPWLRNNILALFSTCSMPLFHKALRHFYYQLSGQCAFLKYTWATFLTVLCSPNTSSIISSSSFIFSFN